MLTHHNWMKEGTDEQMGGIFDLFSSPTKFTKEQELSAGNSWLQALYNELKPSASYQNFMKALRLDSYNTPIPEEDFQDFIRGMGFAVLTNKSISDRVKSAIVKRFSSNKNMLPTRKSISSAFLDPDNVKWTYWDATKVVAGDTAKVVSKTVQTTASVVGNTVAGGAKIISFISRNLTLVAGLAAIGGIWFVYHNRKELSERVKEKAFSKIGLGLKRNPTRKKAKKKKSKPSKKDLIFVLRRNQVRVPASWGYKRLLKEAEKASGKKF